MVSVRQSFVATFSEKQAQMIEAAAETHKNGVHDKKGSDLFKWAVLICIGFQCVERRPYRLHHHITISYKAFLKWCKEHGELKSHDGDCDYLGLLAGVYNFLNDEPEKAEA